MSACLCQEVARLPFRLAVPDQGVTDGGQRIARSLRGSTISSVSELRNYILVMFALKSLRSGIVAVTAVEHVRAVWEFWISRAMIVVRMHEDDALVKERFRSQRPAGRMVRCCIRWGVNASLITLAVVSVSTCA